MSFHAPHLLWLLAPLVLLFSWELARRRAAGAARWPKVTRAWAGAFAVSLGARHTTAESRPRLWLWCGLAALLVALARPQWGVVEERTFDQSREVLLALDLSKSMLAQDLKPSRLDRARLMVTSLLDRLRGERVGLVLFAGTAFLQSPLSADYEVLREFLPELQPGYLPEGGTNYRALLESAIEAFGTSPADRYLIILSDGESTEEGWQELGATLQRKGIRVIGLGLGTAAGAFIPDGGGGFVKDARGAVVLSRLNGATLQELAQTTGGAYADASAWIDLAGLLKKTVEAGRQGEFAEQRAVRLQERFQWFLAPGLALLCLSFWTEFPVRPRERALPLGRRAPSGRPPVARAAAVALGFLALDLGAPRAAAAPPPPPNDPALAAPLAATVGRLAGQERLTAKDYAELAQTTITYGQRAQGAQPPPPAGVIDDALAAVGLGERLDAHAADWPRLRQELEQLRQPPEPPPEQDKQDEQDEKKQQQQQDQKSPPQDQQSPQDQQKKDEQKPDDQSRPDEQKQDQSDPSQPSPEQQKQAQDAFGKMPDQPPPEPKSEEMDEPPAQPPTQKVGGQKEKMREQPVDPSLALPLQKLEQVRDLDSPAKLQQLMQGQQPAPAKKGKDW